MAAASSAPSVRLRYRPVLGKPVSKTTAPRRRAYASWLRGLRGKNGVYVLRRAGSGQVVLVGRSHTGRLARTLVRHFQSGATPSLDPREVEAATAAVGSTCDEVLELHRALAERLRAPRPKPAKHPPRRRAPASTVKKPMSRRSTGARSVGGMEPSLVAVVPTFGPAGGPDRLVLTAKGLAQAGKVATGLDAKALAALEALAALGGRGRKGVGVPIEVLRGSGIAPTPFGEEHAGPEGLSVLTARGLATLLQPSERRDPLAREVCLTEAGHEALARTLEERERLLERALRQQAKAAGVTPAAKAASSVLGEDGMTADQRRRKERAERKARRLSGAVESQWKAARAEIAAIPPGQPILAGHHSQQKHERALERHDRKARRAVELQEAAKAAEWAAQGAGRAVRSDDPDAIPALQARLATLETHREEMKAVNRMFRKGGLDRVKAGVGPEAFQRAAEAWRRVQRFSPGGGKAPYPGYALQNAGSNIRRIRERIARLEKAAAAVAAPDVVGDGYRIEEDQDDNRLRLHLEARPSPELKAALKSRGFRWSRRHTAWQRQLTNQARYAAQQVVKQFFGDGGDTNARIRSAYAALRQETGLPFVLISDLVARRGLPVPVVHAYLEAVRAARRANATLGDPSVATEAQLAAALRISGRPHVYIELYGAAR